MRVLRAGLGLEMARLRGAVLRAVACGYIRARGGERLVGKAQGVRPHICYEADAALSGYLDALIELLCDGHGAARRHAEAARRLLLERGCDERGCGRLLLFAALDGLDDEGRFPHGVYDGVDLRLAFKLRFLIVLAVKARGEAAGILPAVEMRVEEPVLFAFKCLYLFLAVHHHARGDGLHTSGGKAGLYLAPQQRRKLIAHYSVQYAPGLLRVNKVLIYGAGVLYALRDDLFGDLIEGDTLGLFVVKVKKLLQMP